MFMVDEVARVPTGKSHRVGVVDQGELRGCGREMGAQDRTAQQCVSGSNAKQ
jgi:hypothetical protein